MSFSKFYSLYGLKFVESNYTSAPECFCLTELVLWFFMPLLLTGLGWNAVWSFFHCSNFSTILFSVFFSIRVYTDSHSLFHLYKVFFCLSNGLAPSSEGAAILTGTTILCNSYDFKFIAIYRLRLFCSTDLISLLGIVWYGSGFPLSAD